MLGKKKQPGDVGHIRLGTQGTSNEISFSVLHAKSNEAAHDQGAPARPLWELPQEELRERRTKRRRGRRLMVAGLTLAIAGVLAVVGTFVVMNVQRQLDQVANMRWLLQQVVDECDQLQPLNEAVSQALVQTIGSVPAAQIDESYSTASAQSSAGADQLRQLKEQLESAQQRLQLPADKEAANQGIQAVNAQLNLLDMSGDDMAFALPAHQAFAGAQQAMSDILRADELAREATEIMADMNADTAAQSKAKSEECRAALQQAREALLAAQAEVLALTEGEAGNDGEGAGSADAGAAASGENAAPAPAGDPVASGEGAPSAEPSADADSASETASETATSDPTSAPDATIARYLEYVDLRIEAQNAAITSMQAYLDRDKATLQQANDTYNQLESQAAQLIADHAFTPADDVAAAFNAARTARADQWSAELARASVALTAVRDYLA